MDTDEDNPALNNPNRSGKKKRRRKAAKKPLDTEMDLDIDDNGHDGDQMDMDEDNPASNNPNLSTSKNPSSSTSNNPSLSTSNNPNSSTKKIRKRKPRGKGLELQQALNRGKIALGQQMEQATENKRLRNLMDVVVKDPAAKGDEQEAAAKSDEQEAASKKVEQDSYFLEKELYRFQCRIDEFTATVKSLEDNIAELQQQSQKKDEEKAEIKRDLEGKVRQSKTREEYLESSATVSEEENAVLTRRITQQDSRIEQLSTEISRSKSDRKALNVQISDYHNLTS